MTKLARFGLFVPFLAIAAGGVAAAAGTRAAQNAGLHASLSGVLGASQIFTLLFVTLGPIKVIAPFVKATRGAGPALARKIALAAFAASSVALFVGMFFGEKTLDKWNIGLPALIMTAGALLFYVAFRSLIGLYDANDASVEAATPTLRTAISPLTFPVIAPPYGIAVLILLLAAIPEEQSAILISLGAIMVLDLLTMLFARPLLRVAAIPLQLLGTILTVLQAALGVQMLVVGIRSIGG